MALHKHTKIFTVFSFLRLRSPDIFWYQWIYPSIIFVIAFGGMHFVGDQLLSVDKENLIGDINVLMGVLVGFYIAALAAVSSFSNENLDQIMKGRAPTLVSTRKGIETKETLTRRRFLAIMFGYCAILAIILYIMGIFQLHLNAGKDGGACWRIISEVGAQVIWGFYVWITSSLLVTTLLGLHYLVERMHRA